MPLSRKTVMISSTARDLPEHRKEVMNACLSQGMFPTMMEHLPANDDDAISASLKMVDDADIYVGIFGQRYGYIPKGKKRNPKQISITEMEYNHAIKRKIPCLIFVMDKSHPITIDDIEMENAAKLKKFKDRIQTKTVVNFFKSPAELRAQAINSLSKQIESTLVTIPDKEYSIIDVTAYFNALRKRYNVLALEGLTPPQKEEYLQIQLRSVFVEQSVREDTPPVELPKEVWEKLSREQEIHAEDLPSGITLEDVRKARESYYQKPSRLVLDALTDSHNQHTIILGDPGSGKSTLARYVMLSLIHSALAGEKIQKAFEGYLPLLIELRTFAGLYAENKCETPLEFLEHLGKTEGWGLTQNALHNHLKNDGRAVVIFDGLDEIFEPKMRETITNQIVGFTNMYPKACVIVTSRILGYRRKILSDAGFTHFTLQDLDEKQVKAFITKWYELAMSERLDEAKDCSERILKSFKDSASIRQLAGNPMLLTIMAIIGKHQELPRERWKLYDHAASVLIQHWDVNKHLKDESIKADFIGEDDKKELLRRLAYRMQSGDGGLAGNYIHREDLQEEFESYLQDRYSQTPDRAKIIAETMIQQFRERNFILSLYGATVYGFVHRAFLEYFCASAFVWKFEKTKEITIEQLKANVYRKHCVDQNWHEVLRLICGMVDEKWAVEIIQYLSSNISRQLTDGVPWNISLGVQCLQEVRNLNLLHNSAGELLKGIFSLFDQKTTGSSPIFVLLDKSIMPSIQLIGLNYPGRKLLVKWLSERRPTSNSYTMYGELFAGLIDALGKDLDEIFQIIMHDLKSSNDDKRYLALFTFAHIWPDYLDAFDILYDRALNDTSNRVRFAAIYCACVYFRTNPKSFELVLGLAKKDITARTSALNLLVRYFRSTPQTIRIIQSLVINDKSHIIRSQALKDLGKYFPRNAQTQKILFASAVNDISPEEKDKKFDYQRYGRETAIEVIAKYWSDHPDTLPLLRERAENDPTPWLRDRARELIEKIEGKNTIS